MSFKKALDVIRNLPEERRAFIKGRYFGDQLCCAIGALLLDEAGNPLVPNDSDYIKVFAKNPLVSERLASLDLTINEALNLQEINDFCQVYTVEQRYKLVVQWLETQVEKEGAV